MEPKILSASFNPCWMIYGGQEGVSSAPFVAFRLAESLELVLVRAKLPPIHKDPVKGCFRCGKSRCQKCRFMSVGDKFVSYDTGRRHGIGCKYDCGLADLMYLLDFIQYVGSASKSLPDGGRRGSPKTWPSIRFIGSAISPFYTRLKNRKSYSRREGSTCLNRLKLQYEQAGHHKFMDDVSFQVLDRLP